MIISPGRKYIFVHIPKTGGTALSLALENRAMKDDILIGDTPKAVKRRRRLKDVKTAGRLWKHSSLADIDGLISLQDLDDFLIFTLVRNPWDRMVSYYHWLRMQSFDHPAVDLARRLEFVDFLAHPQTQSSIRATPYGHYLRDASGQERTALFVRLEHLSEDLVPLETHLGFRLDEVPRANTSYRNANHRSYYTENTQELVADLCKADIERFGYRF